MQLFCSAPVIRQHIEKTYKVKYSRINLNGAINIDTMKMTVDRPSRVNGRSTICLLEKIDRSYPLAEKIVLYWIMRSIITAET
jgi:hypothetical protein